MSDNTDRSRQSQHQDSSQNRSALNARSSSQGRHVLQPILPLQNPSSSSAANALAKSSGAWEMEALFDCFAKYSKSSSSSTGAAPADEGKAAVPEIVINPGTPQQSTKANKTPVNVTRSAVSESNSLSGLANNNLRLDDDTLWKFVFFSKLQRAINASAAPAAPTAAPPPPQPLLRELNITLHKWLLMVPKLEVSGTNYQTWLVMLQQAIQGTVGRKITLDDPDLILVDNKEILLKTAILATVDDNIKVSVAEEPSGLAGLQLISDTFTLRSRTAHIALVKDLLDTKFNHYNQSANLDAHFRVIENKVNQLLRSGFTLTKESFIGLLFHLSLPNLKILSFCQHREAD
ncbi:hypothetical protein PTTG_09776 [Puccinia triticina 1-1 BBBD Race 1]|uniref:Uncharacterized protein n=1 Tax=Puccinia triticina (isolate 1-1 / race 1 (BBBD)) TaxID=630390 RepID=A0A0C4F9A6_PUCT1|nr:hypothetical protein PTTG_09776 [Puccinia triticina 1-1 BBBD Race 1]